MKSKKIIATLVLAGTIFSTMGISAFADQFNVISIGANLTPTQKQEMLNYFNAPKGSYQEVTINNQQEQEELRGILPESEIGTRTISCAYVQPTQSGGINVKTANLTYVTASMISNALTTAGIYNANVVAAAPFQVSGTGALTGIMTSFEKATGEQISPEKKELANKELEVTSKIAQDSNTGQTKASAVVSGVKAKVIQNGEHSESQIAQTINNVTNNYGVTLTPNQEADLNKLMQSISDQNYNKSEMMKTLDKLQEEANKILQNQGQLKGFLNNLQVHFDNFVNWVKGLFTNKKDEGGIVNQTNNNSTIGKDAVTTGNTDAVENTAPTVDQSKSGVNNNAINVVNSSDTTINTNKPNENTKNSNTQNTNNQTSNENQTNENTSTSATKNSKDNNKQDATTQSQTSQSSQATQNNTSTQNNTNTQSAQ